MVLAKQGKRDLFEELPGRQDSSWYDELHERSHMIDRVQNNNLKFLDSNSAGGGGDKVRRGCGSEK